MRTLSVAVAQLGPIAPDDTRADVVARLIDLLDEGRRRGCRFVVYPELALTTFFPRHHVGDERELDAFFETEMPGPETRPLFGHAARHGVGFCLGYAERVLEGGRIRRFNTAILVDPSGETVAKYRKIHLPGHAEHEPWRPFQHLEKRYFEPGDLGFGVWPFMGARAGMCICNDRRWPETWRVMGLRGVELVALGYNTPLHYPPVPEHDHLQSFHHLLTLQSGAYQNGTYVAAAAKAGPEDGSVLLGHSCIVAPTGEIVAMSSTDGDELIAAECDFDRCAEIKRHIFDFERHRQPRHYALIAADPTPAPDPPPLFDTSVRVGHVINPLGPRHRAGGSSSDANGSASETSGPVADANGPAPDADDPARDADGIERGTARSAFGADADGTTRDPLDEASCRAARQAIAAWPGYAPTPLLELDGLAARLGVASVRYKDEAGRFGLGSFKALGGAYAVSRVLLGHVSGRLGREASVEALAEGRYRDLTAGLTVTCATDGNHGRSVAWGAQRFGCRCVVYIHRDVSESRRQAIERYGAEVVRVAGNYDDSVRQAADDAERLGRTVVSDTSYPGYLDIPADVMRGYTVLADEAYDTIDAAPGAGYPTHVFLQGGVGGFAAAVAVRARARTRGVQPRIVVVEPERAACIFESLGRGEPVPVHGELDTLMAGLACGEVSLIAFDVLAREVDDALTLPDEAAVGCMRMLADGTAGDAPLVAGESAVAGLAALVVARHRPALSARLTLDEGSRILLVGTEGATDARIYRRLVGRDAEAVAIS